MNGRYSLQTRRMPVYFGLDGGVDRRRRGIKRIEVEKEEKDARLPGDQNRRCIGLVGAGERDKRSLERVARDFFAIGAAAQIQLGEPHGLFAEIRYVELERGMRAAVANKHDHRPG